MNPKVDTIHTFVIEVVKLTQIWREGMEVMKISEKWLNRRTRSKLKIEKKNGEILVAFVASNICSMSSM